MFKRILLSLTVIWISLFAAFPVSADDSSPRILGLGSLNSLSLSPDGSRLIVGSSIGLYLYDARSLDRIDFWPTSEAVAKIAWSPKGDRLAILFGEYYWSASLEVWGLDGYVRSLWSIKDTDWDDRIQDMAFTSDGTQIILARTYKMDVRETENGAVVRTNLQREHLWYSYYKAVAASPDGSQAAICCNQGSLEFWNTQTWEVTSQRPATAELMAWHPAGQRLLLANRQYITGPILNLASGSWSGAVETEQGIEIVVFSPTGSQVAVGTTAGNVLVYAVNEFSTTFIRTLRGHTQNVRSVAWSPDGQKLYAVTSNLLTVWDVVSGQQIQSIKSIGGGLHQIVWPTENAPLITTSDRELVQWNIETGQPILSEPLSDTARMTWPQGGTTMVASTEANLLAVADPSGVTLHDLTTLKRLHRLYVGYPIKTVAFSPDGKLLAMAGDRPYINIWDTTTGAPKQDLIGSWDTKSIWAVSFDPTGAYLYSVESTGALRRWDLAAGTSTTRALPIAPQRNYWERSQNAAFSATRSQFFLDQGEAWTLRQSEDVYELFSDGTNSVLSVAFNSSGTKIAILSTDAIKIFETNSGALLQKFTFHVSAIADLTFSPDGSQLAASCSDGTILIWPVP